MEANKNATLLYSNMMQITNTKSIPVITTTSKDNSVICKPKTITIIEKEKFTITEKVTHTETIYSETTNPVSDDTN